MFPNKQSEIYISRKRIMASKEREKWRHTNEKKKESFLFAICVIQAQDYKCNDLKNANNERLKYYNDRQKSFM